MVRRLDRAISRMEDVDNYLLDREPVPGAWTPLETLYHIYLSERKSLDYLLYQLGTERPLNNLNAAARLRARAVIAALKSPMKFKANETIDPRKVELPVEFTLTTIMQLLDETHDEFQDLLKAVPDSWMKSAVYKHPVVGYIGLRDALRFLNVHQERHIFQIRRALAQNARDDRREKASKRTAEKRQ